MSVQSIKYNPINPTPSAPMMKFDEHSNGVVEPFEIADGEDLLQHMDNLVNSQSVIDYDAIRRHARAEGHTIVHKEHMSKHISEATANIVRSRILTGVEQNVPNQISNLTVPDISRDISNILQSSSSNSYTPNTDIAHHEGKYESVYGKEGYSVDYKYEPTEYKSVYE